MKTIVNTLIGALALSALFVPSLQAQTRTTTTATTIAPEPTGFGVQIDFGSDSKFGVGGRIRHSLMGLFPAAPVSGIGSIDIFFPGEGTTYFDFNYNAVYNFTHRDAPKVAPYAGAGLDLAVASGNGASGTQLGVNLVGGAQFPSAHSSMTPYVELRGVLSSGTQLVLTGGIKF
ncbi:MAG TPA: hypothetical protein VGI92_12915 [Gemmatimonadales bacterium]|jgi:hypothetical protein